MNRSTFAKGLVAAIAGAAALGAVATSAQAQPYGQYGYYGDAPPPGYGYNPCQREAGNRGVIGALVGGGIGATVGSQLAANHHRTDGSVLGGVLGALVGAGVGHSTAACDHAYAPPPPPPPAPPAQAYDGYDDYGPAYPQQGRWDGAWAYGRGGERYPIAHAAAGPDGCTLAESPVYLPDGRVEKRFVRVCLDERGRYRVVD
jgi:hypothetical protein